MTQQEWEARPNLCPECNGSGCDYVPVNRCDWWFSPPEYKEVICLVCGGYGTIIGSDTNECMGAISRDDRATTTTPQRHDQADL